MASAHWARTTGMEHTHSPRSCETGESRKFVALVKCVSTMLSSTIMSREIGITTATQLKIVVWSEMGGRSGEGGMSYIPYSNGTLCHPVLQQCTT